MSNKILITLLRHGKVAGAPALYGHTDIELSDQGHSDLWATINQIHNIDPIQRITSSPLIRCARVSTEFSAQHKIPLRIEPQLQEMHFGDWDGVPFETMNGEWKALEVFWHTPSSIQPPQGESLDIFAHRVIQAWQNLLSLHQEGHHLVLCHGGVIRIIIAHILHIDWRKASLFKQLTIDYASHTRIEITDHQDAFPVIKWIGAT